MADLSYLVIRIHPDSPVDAGTFSTYLSGLQIQVYPAGVAPTPPNAPTNFLGETTISPGDVTLFQLPWSSNGYLAVVSKLVASSTQGSGSNYGTNLTVASPEADTGPTIGIAFGSTVTSPANATYFSNSPSVTDISFNSPTLTLSQSIPNFVAAGTVVMFYFEYGVNGNPPITVHWADANPSFSLQMKTNSAPNKSQTVDFTNINGIAIGMEVTAAAGIPGGTTVVGAGGTTVMFSNPITLAKGDEVTFQYSLSSGIVQHVEQQTLGPFTVYFPASVATAVIQVPSQPANSYLDVFVVATRNGLPIPVENSFYNVIVSPASQPLTPDQYQAIPPQKTSLYLTLPAPPVNANAIGLTLPSNGAAPPFDALLPAMQLAVQNDPFFPGNTDLSALSTPQCTRMAYDIVWSQQNSLPLPPDTLEELYTNPPNSGSSSGSGSSDEQDRQKFEGALNSFYSTRNSNAVRLTKFVAAASAALYCENKSVTAAQALLEFPVDPTASPNPSPVESEVLLSGLSKTGTNFGVPAAFFYALGINMDKSATGDARYQIACGDTMERVLQEFGQAVVDGVINDSEQYSYPIPTPPATNTNPSINSAQAARRLTALSVTSASTSPLVPLPSSGPLLDVVQAWLAYPASSGSTLTYQSYQPSDDNGNWAALVVTPPTATPTIQAGFLQLVLDALTQGYLIPGIGLLADQIAKWLPSTTTPPSSNPTVNTLKNVTAAQWTSFFTTVAPANNPLPWFPPFARPGNAPGASQVQLGYIATCITLFIRAVQKFFTVSSVPNKLSLPTPGEPPTFTTPPFDAIGQAVTNLGAGFAFGKGTLSTAQIAAAANGVFSPGTNAEAQAWLEQAIATINELYQIALVVPNATNNVSPVPANLAFSIMEALYARGFRSAKEILELSAEDFQQALTGTVAYAYNGPPGNVLYEAAKNIDKMAPPSPPDTSNGVGFRPINPDGTLTNCIPPPSLSPTGPIAYLNELLQLSESATCDEPLVKPPPSRSESEQQTIRVYAEHLWEEAGRPTAGGLEFWLHAESTLQAKGSVSVFPPSTTGSVLAQRRGPLGNLAASAANLETPLPLIDIVNECLEYMASTTPPQTSGIVYETFVPKNFSGGNPETIFGALPQYSTPSAPSKANQSVEPNAFENLEADFSDCSLPYSQARDVNRTYLQHFGTCRFQEMRTFRRCITEFVLDPQNEPAGFQDHLWRYPVRIDTAIEYLDISPAEFLLLFKGAWPQPCGEGKAIPVRGDDRDLLVWQLYGFNSETLGDSKTPWTQIVCRLPEFLNRTCLTYCEFLDLWRSGFVQFSNGMPERREGREPAAFPNCEPCCLERLQIQFPEQPGAETALYQLAVFIRLWRKLRPLNGADYSFAQLRDICDVLHLFNGNAINRDFVRQLVAFQMFRDDFGLPLSDPTEKAGSAVTGADRSHLLALWAGSNAGKWQWAVKQMLGGIDRWARCQHQCEARPPEFLNALAANLDSLSQIADFDPGSASPNDDRWQALPTHTLRFAELLAKIYASNFRLGEISYLFTTHKSLHLGGPFPLQEEDDALDSPLGLPDDEHEYSLWKLRHKLLEVHLSEEELHDWSWHRIEACLREQFGYAADELLLFGRHFFPATLQSSGHLVDPEHRRYSSGLDPMETTPAMWSATPYGPFQYDAKAKALWTQLPLPDEAVIDQLERLQQLGAPERGAVQDLYFQPRTMLAPFAFFFADFTTAQEHMIQEREEHERWHFFRREFALSYARCRILAERLARHVESATGQSFPQGFSAAFRLLRELYADENQAVTDWEDDTGKPPKVTWAPPPNGGAFAALLGLTGTGLLREFTTDQGTVSWRDVCGALSCFGRERNRMNCPVPSVLPSLGFAPAVPLSTVTVRNGLAVDDTSGIWLGGAQGFTIKWGGALLIDREGRYEFCAGAPTPDCQEPDLEAAASRQWRVKLTRGHKTWLLLNHNWPGETGFVVSHLRLRRGAYEISVEFSQPDPSPDGAKAHRQHTGFQVKYLGPDTDEILIEIPHRQLFRIKKDLQVNQTPGQRDLDLKWQDLGAGIPGLAPNAISFLDGYYTSSLRDIRRTYQRIFKSLLFVHRFGLSAERVADRHSELGFLLSHPDKFAGLSFYRTGPGAYSGHSAYFDFNFLPLVDDYYPPAATQDSRVQPSLKRSQAMFDWWERIFDYEQVRKEVESRCGRHLWHLFEEAVEQQPTDPGILLGHMGADPQHWQIDLRYYQDQNSPIYTLAASDLTDERWVDRVFHSDRWLVALRRSFTVKDITQARPDLWASDDPSSPVQGEGTITGNTNLLSFLSDGCIENGEPRRFEELKRLNDSLRERGRTALVAYLCRMNRVPLLSGTGFVEISRELSDHLLLDVEAGLCQKSSRIEEAITAVQNFVRRARLGLEPNWKVTREFALLWDRRFSSYRVWEACRRRELYQENWIDWDELEKARRIEAFRFLESKLHSASLTVAEPAGGEWWPDQRPRVHAGLMTLQTAVPSSLRQLPTTPPTQEGWTILGTPERNARTSWLAAPSLTGPSTSTSPGDGQPIAQEHFSVLAASAAASTLSSNLPFWIESAIRLGKQFIRVAAAGRPAASAEFVPNTTGRHAGCCLECGRVHPPLVDEYYFWLINSQEFSIPDEANAASSDPTAGSFQFGIQECQYDPTQQQSLCWNDTSQLPPLLHWPANPAVRLAWCRLHNGEFNQPRRSVASVEVASQASIQFLGRAGDSLFFTIEGAAPAPSGDTDPSPVGFRYDLPTEDAVALPLAVEPPKPTSSASPGGLPAYPFFAFDSPGARLFPNSFFAPALAVADALRTRCRFDLALKWYELAFAPLQNDCTWVHCPADSQSDTVATPGAPGSKGVVAPGGTATTQTAAPNSSSQPAVIAAAPAGGNGGTVSGQTSSSQDISQNGPPEGACCDSTNVGHKVIQNRAVILHYCQTLLDWGDHLMRRHPTPEAFQQARLLFDTISKIMGRRPCSVLLDEPASKQSVQSFKPAFPPLNPRLLEIYDHSVNRMELIRSCIDARRLRNGRPNLDMPYFGDNPFREGWRTGINSCAGDTEWCLPHSPYRFMFLIQKAQEFASAVREFGAALLTSYEKGDAEYLASIRAVHERELFALGLAVRQDQWRDADWQIQALQQTKDLNQTNLSYYTNLYQNGLINDEIQHQVLATTAMQTRTGANTVEAEGEIMKVIPDLFVGFPCTDTQVPIGTKLAGLFETIGRVMTIFADIQSATSALDLTLAGWQRRSDEWLHQTQTLPIEIEQIELQIMGAHRRRAQAHRELNNQQRQFEQSSETLDFLRDKFTGDKLYLWMQKETSTLYYKMYELALYAARQAERAFNFERGHTTRHFIPDGTWETLHEGLLAGEHLQVALRRMEKAYLDENVREYELTKHFSLRLQFPRAYLRLRTTGYCEIEIPEWMFDLDYPGHYMRRIKNVTLTIPCVTGPYTGVHCRVTLLSSRTRIDPRLDPPPHHCCRESNHHNPYQLCPHDPRSVEEYAAREAIATSSGQNDSGMFELNFRDDRYLPFEYLGAVSRWRIELPPENNYFDLDTLSDLILNLNYTAREGGELLRRAASEVAERHLPGDGWCFFDVRHEFPDAWQLFRQSPRDRKSRRKLRLTVGRNMFPFIPGHREISITGLALLFETSEAETSAGHRIAFEGNGAGNPRESDEEKIPCMASEDWPRLYHGVHKTRIGPLSNYESRHSATFGFPAETGDISRIFLFFAYETSGEFRPPSERREIPRSQDLRSEADQRLQPLQFAANAGSKLPR